MQETPEKLARIYQEVCQKATAKRKTTIKKQEEIKIEVDNQELEALLASVLCTCMMSPHTRMVAAPPTPPLPQLVPKPTTPPTHEEPSATTCPLCNLPVYKSLRFTDPQDGCGFHNFFAPHHQPSYVRELQLKCLKGCSFFLLVKLS